MPVLSSSPGAVQVRLTVPRAAADRAARLAIAAGAVTSVEVKTAVIVALLLTVKETGLLVEPSTGAPLQWLNTNWPVAGGRQRAGLAALDRSRRR